MTYYRLHRSDAPAFTADNAYSAAWGETFSADGTAYECRTCDGAGTDAFGETCPDGCDEGWADADRGYSCCDAADELIRYFTKHCPADETDPVVEFDGQHVGTGLDGESLVVPTTIVRWTTIGQLRSEVA